MADGHQAPKRLAGRALTWPALAASEPAARTERRGLSRNSRRRGRGFDPGSSPTTGCWFSSLAKTAPPPPRSAVAGILAQLNSAAVARLPTETADAAGAAGGDETAVFDVEGRGLGLPTWPHRSRGTRLERPGVKVDGHGDAASRGLSRRLPASVVVNDVDDRQSSAVRFATV